MVKCSHADFTSVGDPLTCWLSKEVLRRRFFESLLTKLLTVCKFGNNLAITIFFFLKMFKIWWRFQKRNKKIRKKFFFFSDNCVSMRNGKFSQSGTVHLSSTENVLTNTPKMSNFYKGDIFQIISAQSDEEIWWTSCLANFPSVWDLLT